jgi:hypothetical protein
VNFAGELWTPIESASDSRTQSRNTRCAVYKFLSFLFASDYTTYPENVFPFIVLASPVFWLYKRVHMFIESALFGLEGDEKQGEDNSN